VVLKVNPQDRNHPENAEMVRKHGITYYPTIAFLSSEGHLISSNTGYIPPDQFSELMKKTLKEENELENLRAEIQKNPENLKANISLAMIYIKRGNLTKGQALVNTISVLDPSNQSKFFPKVYAEMALAQVNQSNIEEGEALLDKASALDLKDQSAYLPKLHVNFGLFYSQNYQSNKNYLQKSEKHFKTVIDKYPQSEFYEPAQFYLAQIYSIQKKNPMAISLLEKLSSHAQNAAIKREANRILESLKNQSE